MSSSKIRVCPTLRQSMQAAFHRMCGICNKVKHMLQTQRFRGCVFGPKHTRNGWLAT
jgi:hypothetical protein